MTKFFAGYDIIFLVATAILIIFGLFVLASSSLGISSLKFGNSYYYVSHQIFFGFMPGIILMFFAAKFNYRKWRKLSLWLMIFAVFLMVLVFTPAGFYHGGAKRWLYFFNASFQPSEFLKFAFIVYLASWLESRSKEIVSFKYGFLPFFIMIVSVSSFLVLQPDIGTLLVLLLSVFSLFFVSGGKFKQIALLSFMSTAFFLTLIYLKPYLYSRVTIFLNPANDVAGAGYQLNQALTAIGSGGIFGKGFGLSFHKLGLLPEVLGDSIFAVLGEEFGFLGVVFFLTLFLFIFLRGIYIINRTEDVFGYLLGIGILFTITYQAIINMAAISGIFPLTGIPLSFVSFGGSALAIMMGEIGVLLNISKKS